MFHKGCRQLDLHLDISLFSLNSSQGLSLIHHGRAEVKEQLSVLLCYTHIETISKMLQVNGIILFDKSLVVKQSLTDIISKKNSGT